MASLEPTKQDMLNLGITEKIQDQECLSGLKEVASYLEISISTVRRLIKHSGFPAAQHTYSGKYFITKTSIQRWMVQNSIHNMIQRRVGHVLSQEETNRIINISQHKGNLK